MNEIQNLASIASNDFKRKHHRKYASFAQLAFDLDLSMHRLDDIFRDRHAETRPLDPADRGLLARSKGSKIFATNSEDIPIPLSFTTNRYHVL